MRIPDKVKIGGNLYDVNVTHEILLLDNMACGGIINLEDLEIKLNNQRNPQKIEQNFLHEIIHAICRDRDLNFEQDEEVVEAFSKGLHAFIKDNPEIFKEDLQ